MLDVLFSSIFTAIISKWDKALYTKSPSSDAEPLNRDNNGADRAGRCLCSQGHIVNAVTLRDNDDILHSRGNRRGKKRLYFLSQEKEMIYHNKEGLNSIARRALSAISSP